MAHEGLGFHQFAGVLTKTGIENFEGKTLAGEGPGGQAELHNVKALKQVYSRAREAREDGDCWSKAQG